MTPLAQAAAVAALALGTGAATVTAMNEDIADLAVPDMAWDDGGDLDGHVLTVSAVAQDSGDVLTDELQFQDGRFLSVNCQRYCDFGWTPYQSWTSDGTTHFTVTTRCPDAPHTVVFYGTVTNGAAILQATWTTRRWYWTHQINISGDGRLHPLPDAAVSG